MTDNGAISRRAFGAGAAGLAALGTTQASAKSVKPAAVPIGKPFVMTTWEFGPGANAVGWPMLAVLTTLQTLTMLRQLLRRQYGFRA